MINTIEKLAPKWAWRKRLRLIAWLYVTHYRRNPGKAVNAFKALRDRIAGIHERVGAGDDPQGDVLDEIVFWLETLSIWPRAMRGERAADKIAKEVDYLYDCTEHEYGLDLARARFPKSGDQEWRGDGDDFLNDQLGWHHDQMQKRIEERDSREG